MVLTTSIELSVKKSFKNFLRLKKTTGREVIKAIVKESWKYNEKDYTSQGKEQISLRCDEEDFSELKNIFFKNCAEKKYVQGELKEVKTKFGDYVSKLIYNYMWVHKDDKPKERRSGKTACIYFSSEEWEKLQDIAGDKKIAIYIKEKLGL